jgi:uncharacterized protein (TIGR00106 family)
MSSLPRNHYFLLKVSSHQMDHPAKFSVKSNGGSKMSRTVNVSIQVLPLTSDPYPVVDRAIAIIQGSGVKYEVGPMETTLEGELDELLEVVKAAHRACFTEGVERVVTIVKIADAVSGTSIEEKVAKYRQG